MNPVETKKIMAIAVPLPCAQRWDDMEPAPTGRQCASCRKTVVDFSCYRPAEIVAYLAQAGAAGTCGRFRTGQVPRPGRLLNWYAAPKLALALASVLTLVHCSPDTQSPLPHPPAVANQQAGQLVRGKVLDQESGRPLAGALIICEADTLCQARTAADGSFSLLVPAHLTHHKLIAALVEKSKPRMVDGEYDCRPYIPRYFSAGSDVRVRLRRTPPVLGHARLEPGETYAPPIRQYLVKEVQVPPPPKLTVLKSVPPAKHSPH